MRIISGQFKGFKLLKIDKQGIRPTLGRAKESIFNILSSILKKRCKDYFDLTVIDGFCGTGALGIEALSRGAKEVLFIDNSKHSIELVKKNCELLKIHERVSFHLGDILKLNKKNYMADLFFLDPPYSFKDYDLFFKTFDQKRIFAKEAIVILETSKSISFLELEKFSTIKKKKISNSNFFFLEYSSSSSVK